MSEQIRILVVDDEPRAVELVARALRKLGHVECMGSGDEAWARARRESFDLVVSDQRMPGLSGVELLSRIAQHSLRTGRILITAYDTMHDTIAAINHGKIHAYLSKPSTPDEIRATARSVLELVSGYGGQSAPILGESAAIRELRDQVDQVAAGRFPVLILGETGTGKELVARRLHEKSPRARQAFVPINCGALPESLLESELFGHQRGAFTGADGDKIGLFALADGGTLFLDEIGETSPAFQVRLLRVLETQLVRPLGGTETRSARVRLVSATHRDIESMVKERDFRQDLYYRINTITLQVPPLRARRDDIPLLARAFAKDFELKNGFAGELSDAAIEALCGMDFPGNVRELRGTIERAIVMAGPDGIVAPHHFDRQTERTEPAATRGQSREPESLRARVEALQAQAIREALAQCADNRTQAAEMLGLSRPGLTKMIRRLGLDEDCR